MAKRTMLTIIAIIVGFIGFVFSIVGLATNNWLVTDDVNTGLWVTCDDSECTTLEIGKDRIYSGYEIVRGFGVLAVCMVFFGTFVAVASLLFQNKFKIDASVLASLFMMSALFSLICAAVFTGINSKVDRSYGYSFGLTWASFPMMLISGVLSTYLALSATS